MHRVRSFIAEKSSGLGHVKAIYLMFLVFACLNVLSIVVNAQVVKLKQKEFSLDVLFSEIRRQTGYDFVYTTHQFNTSRKVKIRSNHTTLQKLLDDCFAGQQITYVIRNETIIIKGKGKTNQQGLKCIF